MAKTRAPRTPRAQAPAQPLPVQAIEAADVAGPDALVPAPAAPAAPEPVGDAQPPCVTPTASGGRCWQITRSRYVGGRLERYCEGCSAIESAVALSDRGLKAKAAE